MRLLSEIGHFAWATMLTFGSPFSRASMPHRDRPLRSILKKRSLRESDHKHPNAIPAAERLTKNRRRHRHKPIPAKKSGKRLRLNDGIGERILQMGTRLDGTGVHAVDLIDAQAELFDIDTFSQVSFGEFVDGEWRPSTANSFSIDAVASVFGDRKLQELVFYPHFCASCLSDPQEFTSALGSIYTFLSAPGANIPVFDEPMFKRKRVT